MAHGMIGQNRFASLHRHCNGKRQRTFITELPDRATGRHGSDEPVPPENPVIGEVKIKTGT
jgi:hypothetical protein